MRAVELSASYRDALDYAWRLHGAERRKAGEVPTLAHLLGVSALVLGAGGTEAEGIAALLHDAAEDHGGVQRLDDIRRRFGSDVAEIVRLCSDSLEEDPGAKAPWWPRKVGYVHRLDALPPLAPALTVAAADKLDNARSLLHEYRIDGEAVWARFDAASGRAGQLWYYGRLATMFEARLAGDPRRAQLARQLTEVLRGLRDSIVASGGADPALLEQEIEAGRRRERELSLGPAC